MIIPGTRLASRRELRRTPACPSWTTVAVRMAVLLTAAGFAPVRADAADLPPASIVEVLIQPRAAELVVHLHVPAAALIDAALPHLKDGRLAPSAIAAPLQIVAAEIARNLDVRQDDGALGAPLALARIGADERSVDVELTYVVQPPSSGISARLNAFRSEQQPVQTHARYLMPSGRAQDITFSGAPTRVLFDPDAADAVLETLTRGVRALFDSADLLLLLICLLAPLRSARAAAALVAVLALGQTMAMIVSMTAIEAHGDGLIAVGMIAASTIVVVALQNIVGARSRWAVWTAVAFGVLNGFAFGGGFAAAAPYAGAHYLLAFAAFAFVVTIGSLWLGATLWAARSWLDSRSIPERVVAILISVMAAHEALHRVAERGRLLADSGSFGGERALVWLTLGWIAVMLAAAIANAWSARSRGAGDVTALGQTANA